MAITPEQRANRLRRIERMKARGVRNRDIIDAIDGPKDRIRITRQELEAMGVGPRRIERFLARYKVDQRGNPAPGGETNPDQPKTSAYDEFRHFLESMGIPYGADIEAIIQQAVIDGITPDRINLVLPDIQNTNTWKQRFPGWHQRVSNGYNQLSVAQYLDLEDTYHRIMQEAGLPQGFYDDPSDFGNWIANNVSPQEIQGRVNTAMDAVRQVDPTARDLLSKFYGVTAGDLASYFLDQKRALPVLDRQWKAVNVAQWASKNGLQVQGARHYEDLVDKGVTPEMAAQGYGTVAAFNQAFGQLGGIYGESYSQADAENDVFFNQNDKRRKLMAKEAATFSGSSRGATGKAKRETSY